MAEDIKILDPKTQKVNSAEKGMPSIYLCILLDLVGIVSYSVLGLGEYIDFIWAPVSSFILYRLFGSKSLPFTLVQFVEEAFPFSDVIPTFTIAWFYYRFKNKFLK